MANRPTYKLLPEDKCLTEQQLFDYIDGKLNATEMHVAEKHMLACEMCSDALEGLEKVKNRDKVAAFIPASVFEIKEEKTEAKIIPLHPNRKYFAMAAGLVLIIALSLFFKYSVSDKLESATMADNQKKNDSVSGLIIPQEATGAKMDSVASEKGTVTTSTSRIQPMAGADHSDAGPPPMVGDESPSVVSGNMRAEDESVVESTATSAEGFNNRFSLDEKALETQQQNNVDLAKKESAQPDSDKLSDLKNVVVYDDVVQTEEKDKQSKRNNDAKPTANSKTPAAVPASSVGQAASGTSATTVADQEQVSMTDTVSQTPKFFPLKPTDKDLDLSYTNGVKMLDSGKAEASLVFFDEVLKNPKHRYYEDAQWKKSVALIQLNRKPEAKILLQDIEKKGGKYKAQASAELKKL